MRHKNYGTVETKRASCHKQKTQPSKHFSSLQVTRGTPRLYKETPNSAQKAHCQFLILNYEAQRSWRWALSAP